MRSAGMTPAGGQVTLTALGDTASAVRRLVDLSSHRRARRHVDVTPSGRTDDSISHRRHGTRVAVHLVSEPTRWTAPIDHLTGLI
jgi:hypothetical protein